MKLLVRWSVVIGLLGSSLLGPSLLGSMSAIALPEAEVLKRLQSIPVFTVANEQGSPILASDPQQKNGPQIATFFVSQKEAQGFLNQIKAKNAAVGKLPGLSRLLWVKLLRLPGKIERRRTLPFSLSRPKKQ